MSGQFLELMQGLSLPIYGPVEPFADFWQGWVLNSRFDKSPGSLDHLINENLTLDLILIP